MPMPTYQIGCTSPDCKQLAVYKIAARWSDGVAAELKTYGLCCAEHLRASFARARARHQACHLTAGETLETPGIYQLQHGERDQSLRRLPDVERDLE